MSVEAPPPSRRAGRLARAWNSDLASSFRANVPAVIAAIVFLAMLAGALLAPWIAPTNPYDIRTLDLANSLLPPVWSRDGQWPYLLGTDDQGADVLSSILFGMRISLGVGIASVAVSLAIGVGLGLVAAYFGGVLDSLIMRAADVQLTFPAFLMALLIGGVTQAMLSAQGRARIAIPLVILALGIAHWPHFARLARAAALVEKGKDYVLAAQVMRQSRARIMFTHLLPNVSTPLLVLATLDFAFAIMGEATLSFLGVGVPITQPSLGTLIRFGYQQLFSGYWWIVVFPSLILIVLVVAINVLGDWLRDAANPKLR
jgi:peptide/nickel transport system permease protein